MSIPKTENGSVLASTAFTSELPSNSSIEVSNDLLFLDLCPVDNSHASEKALKDNSDVIISKKGPKLGFNPGSKSEEEFDELNVKIEVSENDDTSVDFAVIGQPLAMSSPSSCAFNPKDVTSLASTVDSFSAVNALKTGTTGGLQVPCKRNTGWSLD